MCLSDSGATACSNACARLRADGTVHGLRSSFRDWAAETTAYPNEMLEIALAHTIGEQGRGRLSPRRHDGEASPAHGGLGELL